jgi:autotransporter-associated beta strand protein
LGYFTIVGASRAAAIAAANALVTPTAFGGHAADYLSSKDLSALANFSFYTATAVAFTTSSVVGICGGNVVASACLTAGGQPLANEILSFMLNGATVGTATTNAGGTATLANISLSGIPIGNYAGCLSVSFAGDATHWTSSASANLAVITPPAVSVMLVENGLTERSYVDQLTFQFNEPVTSTAAVPMTLTEFDTLGSLVGPVNLTASEFQWSTAPGTGASVLTWSLESFAGGTTSLPDGYYELTLPNGQITDQYGNPLNAGTDYAASFFVLQGDVNGDGVVDNNDMLAVDAVLGSRPGSSNWNPDADLNRNGTVTTSDRLMVYENMGHSITPPTGSAGQVIAAPVASLPGWSFDASTRPTVTNSLPDGSPVNGVTFNAGAGASILDGNGVELSGGIVNQSPNSQTVNLPLTLTGNQTIDTAAGSVVVAGSIGQSGGGFGITKTGSQTLVLSGANTYTGGTAVNQGMLVVTNAGALPSGTGLTVAAGGVFVFDPSQATSGAGVSPALVAGTAAPQELGAGRATQSGVSGGQAIPAAENIEVATAFPSPAAATVSPTISAHAEDLWRQVGGGPRQVENLSYSQAHDAVLQSFTGRPAMESKAAAALSAWEGGWSNGPSDATHDSSDSAVDAVMAMLERT